MNKLTATLRNIAIAAILVSAASCNDDDEKTSGPGTGNNGFVVGSFYETSQGEGMYLTTTSSLDEGTISAKGNGAEVQAFSLFNRAGNTFLAHMPWEGGLTNSYEMRNGAPVKIQETLLNVDGRVRAITNDNTAIFVSHAGIEGHDNYYTAFRMNDKGEVIHAKKLKGFDFPDPAYTSHPQGAIAINGKFYVLSTAITYDPEWLADAHGVDVTVYSYPEFEYLGSSRDTRVGGNLSSGSYSPVMINDESGNIYTISCASKVAGFTLPSTSGVLRINKGSNEFDASYFFDVEAAGYKVFSGVYAGNGKVVAKVLSVADDEAGEQFEWFAPATYRIAVLDLTAKTVKVVTDIPEHNIVDATAYLVKDGSVYTVVNNAADGGYVYKVNATEGTATKGAKIDGGVCMYLDTY